MKVFPLELAYDGYFEDLTIAPPEEPKEKEKESAIMEAMPTLSSPSNTQDVAHHVVHTAPSLQAEPEYQHWPSVQTSSCKDSELVQLTRLEFGLLCMLAGAGLALILTERQQHR